MAIADGAHQAAMTREELAAPPSMGRASVRRRVLTLVAVIAVVVAVVTLVPGLADVRSRFAHGNPYWLTLGAVLKLLSGLCFVAAFRSVFCRGMSWRLSGEIGLSELGANAVIPTGGAGGLALGAWALNRAGMDRARIARRSVAFFFLTSLPNVLGVLIIGVGLAVGLFSGHASLPLTIVPAAAAAGAIALTLAGGRLAAAAERRRSAAGRADSRLTKALRAFADGVTEMLALLRGHDPWLLIGLAGYLAFDVMVLWATFHAFGATPPLAILWLGYLIGELGGLIPVPGGIGGVDLGLIGTLVLYHVPAAAATAAVLAYRGIALLVPAAYGAVAFVLLRRSLAKERVAIANCEPGGQVQVIGRGTVRLGA
ncbi:MAG TPA: flippase-like domain-containing protein [Solirubrobacteraceae bacterium]|nr:flippase-like domain-containing protein [Solirubrobacteraceae bacterium]